MSKRTHIKNNCDNNIELSLPFDIWSDILLFFDDFPLITSNMDPFLMIFDIGEKIMSISKLMNLSLVCKDFKKLIDSNDLFNIWKTIFIYNIVNKLEIPLIEERINDTDNNQLKILIRDIVIINHKMHIKTNDIFRNCEISEVKYRSNNISSLIFPLIEVSNRYKEKYNDVIQKYEEDIINIKIYIEKLKETINLIK